jgi:hypothetical protein
MAIMRAGAHELAAKLSVVYGVHITPCFDGFRVRETDTGWVDVLPMLVNWRVTRTRKDNPGGWDRGYCYFGRDVIALHRAINGALNWNPDDPGDHPPGWDKNAITGELPPLDDPRGNRLGSG